VVFDLNINFPGSGLDIL